MAVSPDGNFALIAGDPNGAHTQVSISESAVAITALLASSVMATVVAETNGEVKISSEQKITIDAPQVITQGGRTNNGAQGGMGVARMNDPIVGTCPTGGVGGSIIGGSSMVTAL
jgi:hypothetical protein